jgi:PAS domain S-box-containing protein
MTQSASESADEVLRLRELVEGSPSALLRCSRALQLLYVNPAARALFCDLELVVGSKLPPALAGPAREVMSRGARASRFEITCGEHVLEVGVRDTGTELHLYGTDLAQFRRTAEAARVGEPCLEALSKSGLLGTAMFRTTGEIVNMNDTLLGMLGYTREDVASGRIRWEVFTAPESIEAARGAMEEMRSQGWCAPIQTVYVRKDGTRFPGLFAGALPPACEVGAAFIIDVSKRVRAEEEVEQVRALLAEAGEMVQLGAWYLDFDEEGRPTPAYWSPQVYRIFGYPESCKPNARLYFERVHQDDRQRVRDTLSAALVDKRPYRVEYRIVREDGTERTVLDVARLFYDERGRPKRLVGAVQDVTDQRRLESALREGDRRKNEFLAMLSHELRNPLMPIHNCLRLLSRAEQPKDAERAREIIERQVQHLTRLIDDLLDITRITRGKLELRRAAVLLNEVVRQAAEDHAGLSERAGIALEVSVPDEPLCADADATRLSQAIGNLLGNALKFTPRGGHAWLTLLRSGSDALVVVRDDGPGISPEVLANVFEPFVQADRTLERSGGGLGLGLALVKGLVELHGGTVSACSPGAGKGAEFTIRIPLSKTAEASVATGSESARAPSHRVLVIEDNVDAAESLKELLELDGHVVEVAHEGPEGLAKARAFKPDVVICDIGLPGIDGYQVAREMRKDPELRSAYLVALSGYARKEDVEESRAAGFTRHLAKPPSLQALERILAEAP